MAGMLYERAARVEHTCHHQTYVHARQNRTPLLGNRCISVMRKLSKIVYTATLENSKCIQQENENVCHTHRAYGSGTQPPVNPRDTLLTPRVFLACGMLPRVEGPTC